MNIVFAGTPEFAVPALRTLLDSDHAIKAVYTQPDRPAGRGCKLRASPVKEVALAAGLKVYQPENLKGSEAQQELAVLQPDLMVVVAYGLILPAAVLRIPLRGCVNVHASLLPRWRGAAPIQRAIIAGDTETGVTLMQMEVGLDSGPILAAAKCPIHSADTAGLLHDRLAQLGAELLGHHLDVILAGRLKPEPQDASRATYAAKLDKREAALDWTLPATVLQRRINAFNPWPVAQTFFEGQALRIWRARTIDYGNRTASPGCVIAYGKDGIDVACGKGALRLLELQLPGGRRMAAGDFANARSLDGRCFASAIAGS